MKKFTIVPPEPEHLAYIAANLRKADLAELAALTKRPTTFDAASEWTNVAPLRAIGELTTGQKYVIVNNASTPMAVFGLRKIQRREAIIWFVGTDEVGLYSRELLVCGRLVIKDWLRDYDLLCNIVHVNNKAAMRMLKKWGFTFLPAMKAGPRGDKFHPFFISKHSGVVPTFQAISSPFPTNYCEGINQNCL